MGGKDDNLTQEEIWDDSALIDSWNDALEEYKKYHSIHAKGGSLKDLEATGTNQSQVKSENGTKTVDRAHFRQTITLGKALALKWFPASHF
ncbi:hypothetical protein NLU13_5225 [Sarocladium strictum]|uniref:Survival Motor Neuron Gemin2-binding domain-containing protein n=1 Tax=Sarocladium strictum TaxID=5046 RepID=A0AA39L7F7_SARSR|nr:hypothetical protein NLU13_5225 [Sarocladium strictum]